MFYTAECFNGFVVGDVASESVYGIGGVYNQSSGMQCVHHLFYSPWVGVFGVNSYQFRHVFFFAEAAIYASADANLIISF